ncbi:MAG: hypothetical protein HC849_20380 [Oscillatoriales cyanobacterium RU_3_3]|nr:hypothetical protein [Oscillatoriales cyanobacterium RU_3_3]
MNLSFKDLRFIIEAIEHQIDAYKERLQVIEDIDEDEAADLGNDIKIFRTSPHRPDDKFSSGYISQTCNL